ncbi:MAG: exodeoxyribonuclease IX [Arenimonas sp.]|nr:exodeoxyribonuclease IX [Arenimonas sp.]
MNPLYLVDSSMYVFRAWFSMPKEFFDVDQNPTNAVQGFTRFLCELIEREKPERIVFAFDESLDSNFRNELYPAYKANRDPAPEELKVQFDYCKRLCRALGFQVLADGYFEADDLIGSALTQARAEGRPSLILSADKDLSQLLGEHDEQWDYAKNVRWRLPGVKAKHGVHAHQLADYLGLTGDAVDNIPGVPGIGPKTAATLLGHFGNLDTLLERLEELPYLRLRSAAIHARTLHEHREMALLSRKLATIRCDVPLPQERALGARQTSDGDGLQALAERLRLGPLTRRRLLSL